MLRQDRLFPLELAGQRIGCVNDIWRERLLAQEAAIFREENGVLKALDDEPDFTARSATSPPPRCAGATPAGSTAGATKNSPPISATAHRPSRWNAPRSVRWG
ncbi:hypothetical protein ACFSQE_11800 [Vogesella fluminis]|uniref:hypothetical protein n=1 Tax=Vogesella fluminis TaxID=1069161 RepID=UPI003645D171